MSSILKVDQLQDSGGNAIITSDGAGNITPASAFATTNGITMADQWRLSANTNSGTNADVTTNWERVDENSWGSIGTGLTESSGIFSFPQTGIYLITFNALFLAGSINGTVILRLQTTIDNSTYQVSARAADGNAVSGNSASVSSSNSSLIDVTDISNVKFKFTTANFLSGSDLRGSTSETYTGFTVIRLGDT